VTIVIVEVEIKALDYHIERLEAKLSFLIRSYEEDLRTDLSDQHKKKIATVKQEINDAVERRQSLISLEQTSVIGYSAF
jgi:hypothetical protein